MGNKFRGGMPGMGNMGNMMKQMRWCKSRRKDCTINLQIKNRKCC